LLQLVFHFYSYLNVLKVSTKKQHYPELKLVKSNFTSFTHANYGENFRFRIIVLLDVLLFRSKMAFCRLSIHQALNEIYHL